MLVSIQQLDWLSSWPFQSGDPPPPNSTTVQFWRCCCVIQQMALLRSTAVLHFICSTRLLAETTPSVGFQDTIFVWREAQKTLVLCNLTCTFDEQFCNHHQFSISLFPSDLTWKSVVWSPLENVEDVLDASLDGQNLDGCGHDVPGSNETRLDGSSCLHHGDAQQVDVNVVYSFVVQV